MKKILVVLICVLMASSSLLAQTRAEKKKAKKEKAKNEFVAMTEVIESGKMRINIERASGKRGRSIQLTGQSYNLIIDGSKGKTDLPFYGTSQNAGYGADTGISFDGELLEYSVKYKDKKNKAMIRFKAKSENNEQHSFMITLSGWSASISVNSTYKSSMSYSGKLKEL
ncbi:MAG: DUF4251 domain-containing protein [Reichenbachiella sp.]